MSIDSKRFHAALDDLDVARAFAVLEAMPDLPARQLPKTTRATLQPLLDDPDARRALVGGLFSPTSNVRKWVKRQARHLGGPAAAELTALLHASWEPFRTADAHSLAGDWDGLTSPLGAHVRRLGLPTTLQRRGDAYSPAMRYVKEALRTAAEALATAEPLRVLQLKELLEAKGRSPIDREDPGAPHDHGGLDQLYLAFHQALHKALPKVQRSQDDVRTAALAWIDGASLGDDDPVLGPWLDQALTTADRRTRRRRLRWAVTDLLAALENEDRVLLYGKLSQTCRALPHGPEKRWLQHQLEQLRARFPWELQDPEADLEVLETQIAHLRTQLAPEGLFADMPGMQQTLVQQLRELEGRASALEDSMAGEEDPTADRDGPSLDLVLESLGDLAESLGLHHVRRKLHAQAGVPDLDDWVRDDDKEGEMKEAPEEPLPLEDEDSRITAAILGLRDVVSQAAPDHAFQGRRLGERVLEDYAHAPALLAGVMQGRTRMECRTPLDPGNLVLGKGSRTLGLTFTLRWALALLPRSLWPAFGAWFAGEAEQARASWSHIHDDTLGQLALQRPVTDPDLAMPWIRSLEFPRSDGVRQVVLAGLLAAGGDSRSTALQLIRELPLPTRAVKREENGQQPAWDAAAWKAWQADDAEVLAAMLESVQLPYYRRNGKGAQALIPPLESAAWLPSQERYRKPRPASGGASLKDVVERIATQAPDRLESIAEAALRAGDHSWLAQRTVTHLARLRGFVFPGEALLDALESTSAPVVRGALDALARCPASAESQFEDFVRTLDRLTGAGTHGVIDHTARALNALAKTRPERAGDLLALAEDAG